MPPCHGGVHGFESRTHCRAKGNIQQFFFKHLSVKKELWVRTPHPTEWLSIRVSLIGQNIETVSWQWLLAEYWTVGTPLNKAKWILRTPRVSSTLTAVTIPGGFLFMKPWILLGARRSVTVPGGQKSASSYVWLGPCQGDWSKRISKCTSGYVIRDRSG